MTLEFETLINEGGVKAVREIVFDILRGVYPIQVNCDEDDSSTAKNLEEMIIVSGQNVINYTFNNLHLYVEDEESFLIEIMENLGTDMKIVASMDAATSRQVSLRLVSLIGVEKLIKLT